MRDPARIDPILDQLRDLWKANPDLRLGQLLVNVIRPNQPCPQIFYPEDSVVAKGLAAYPTPNGDRYTANEVTMELTKAEAMVLIAFLLRFRDSAILAIRDQAEEQILYDVCALLQRHLADELLDPAWVKLLDDARKTVRVGTP